MEAARRLLQGVDDTDQQEKALAALGLKPETPLEKRTCEIWPETVKPLAVFRRALTQWCVGPGGVIGLRYEALPFVLQLEDVPAHDWPDVMAGVQVMEQEALRIWSKRE